MGTKFFKQKKRFSSSSECPLRKLISIKFYLALLLFIFIGCGNDCPDNYMPASFVVSDSTAIMNGVIDGTTPSRVRDLIANYPEVHTIIMENIDGSANDDSNLVAARLVRKHGLNTHIPSNGLVASGGTDFFLAGVVRTAEECAKLGVHSWADDEDDTEGTDYPRDHECHKLFLDYYAEMDIPSAFYWFTLEIAPANNIHWMTTEEIELYHVTTPEKAAE
ncbi:MAG: alpha/beta hydrolase [FCB group bacterium]|nr:alpha/beta hydrolase [FCB group bacterium]